LKEAYLRRWHRNLGILLALFIILQAGSGLLISLGEFSVPHTHANEEVYGSPQKYEEAESLWYKSLEFIHHGRGTIGSIYRILVGIGFVGMAVSGSMIFFKIRSRSRKN
jgi:hypothetical protein